MPTRLDTLGSFSFYIEGVTVGEFDKAEITWAAEEPDITDETRPKMLTAFSPELEITGSITFSKHTSRMLYRLFALGWRAKGHPRLRMIERAKRLRKKAVIF